MRNWYVHHGFLNCQPSIARARQYYDEQQAAKVDGRPACGWPGSFEAGVRDEAIAAVKALPGIETKDVLVTASFGFSYDEKNPTHPVIQGSSHCIWTVEAKLADPAPFIVVISRAYLNRVWGNTHYPDRECLVKTITKFEQTMLSVFKNDKLTKRRIV